MLFTPSHIDMHPSLYLPKWSCADPESFVRGVQLWQRFFLVWWGEEGSKYHYKRAMIGPPAKRHLNGVSLACRWWPYIECWLGSFVNFKGIRTSIAKKPYIFVIFQGVGVRTPVHPLDPHMMYVLCFFSLFGLRIEKQRILQECSCLIEFIKQVGKVIKCEACRAFYYFFVTSLINLIIHEHEC